MCERGKRKLRNPISWPLGEAGDEVLLKAEDSLEDRSEDLK